MRLLERLTGKGKSTNQVSLVELVKSLSDYQKRPIEERSRVVAYQFRGGGLLRDDSGQQRIDKRRERAAQDFENNRQRVIELARRNPNDVTQQLYFMAVDQAGGLAAIAGSLLSDLVQELGSQIIDKVFACILAGHEDPDLSSLLLIILLDAYQARVGPLPLTTKDALMAALNDPRAEVRSCAVDALKNVGGADVIARLKELSKSDPDIKV